MTTCRHAWERERRERGEGREGKGERKRERGRERGREREMACDLTMVNVAVIVREMSVIHMTR